MVKNVQTVSIYCPDWQGLGTIMVNNINGGTVAMQKPTLYRDIVCITV